jgi:hypothetical protein
VLRGLEILRSEEIEKSTVMESDYDEKAEMNIVFCKES